MTPESPITIVEERPDTPDAIALIEELDVQLTSHDYPEESRHAFSIEKLLNENVAFFVTRYQGQVAGCGGIKLFGVEFGEIKRMFVRPNFRRLGLGKEMLNHLAAYAQRNDVCLLRLETGIHQVEAIGLYERMGFQRCPPFAEYKLDPNSIYMEKLIVSVSGA